MSFRVLVCGLLLLSPVARAAGANGALASEKTGTLQHYKERLTHALVRIARNRDHFGGTHTHDGLERKVRDAIDDANHMTDKEFFSAAYEQRGDEAGKWQLKRELASQYPGKQFKLEVVGRQAGDALHPITGEGERDIRATLLNPTTVAEKLRLAKTSHLLAHVSLCAGGGACVLPDVRSLAPQYRLGRGLQNVSESLAFGAMTNGSLAKQTLASGLGILGGAKTLVALGTTVVANPVTIAVTATGVGGYLVIKGRQQQHAEQLAARDQVVDWVLKRGLEETNAKQAFGFYKQTLKDMGHGTPPIQEKEFWGWLNTETRLQQGPHAPAASHTAPEVSPAAPAPPTN